MPTTLEPQTMEALLHGECADVFSVLGMHPLDDGWVVRAFLPDATSVRVVERGGQGGSFPAVKIHAEGLFEARIAGCSKPFAYHLAVTDAQGAVRYCRDPYSFWAAACAPRPIPLQRRNPLPRPRGAGGASALHRRGRGHVFCGVGTECPQGQRSWRFQRLGRSAALHAPAGGGRSLELFVPEVGAGALYKYEILSRAGTVLLKSDPFAFATERPPHTASAVCQGDAFAWGDSAWMARATGVQLARGPPSPYTRCISALGDATAMPISTTARWLTQLVAHVAELGFTHIELMPVAEHPFDGSWGYQGTGYFAPSARFGAPEDFAYFIDYCHRHAIRCDSRLGAWALPQRRPRLGSI